MFPCSPLRFCKERHTAPTITNKMIDCSNKIYNNINFTGNLNKILIHRLRFNQLLTILGLLITRNEISKSKCNNLLQQFKTPLKL